MERLKTGGLQFLLLAALSVFGIGCVASQADARSMITSEQELLEVVEEADAGWDWVPNCGDNAVWDTDEDRCKGGNGDDRKDRKREQDSYDIDSKEELLAKIREVDAGWNWIPRCGDHARWSWNENACVGGNNNEHDDDDDDDDDNNKDKKDGDKDKKDKRHHCSKKKCGNDRYDKKHDGKYQKDKGVQDNDKKHGNGNSKRK
ncbi:MAG: hypothetical protein ACOYB5_02270 [Patescibacteria group bacterium]|jgi:hypothetical protein|nr:hypothetical protein [Candidatus Moranbacteria bacterium]